jgi:hypothetical protein
LKLFFHFDLSYFLVGISKSMLGLAFWIQKLKIFQALVLIRQFSSSFRRMEHFLVK